MGSFIVRHASLSGVYLSEYDEDGNFIARRAVPGVLDSSGGRGMASHGTLLAMSTATGVVVVDTAASWAEVYRNDVLGPGNGTVSFSPDGAYLIVASNFANFGVGAAIVRVSDWSVIATRGAVTGGNAAFTQDSLGVVLGLGTNGGYYDLAFNAVAVRSIFGAAHPLDIGGQFAVVPQGGSTNIQLMDFNPSPVATTGFLSGVGNIIRYMAIDPVSGYLVYTGDRSPYIKYQPVAPVSWVTPYTSTPAPVDLPGGAPAAPARGIAFNADGSRMAVTDGSTTGLTIYAGLLGSKLTLSAPVGAQSYAVAWVGLSAPAYAIEPDVTEANEGDTVTFDITAPDDADLYYQITGDITADDIASGTLTGTITITSGSGSLAVELLEDGTLEGSEEFAVELYTDSGLTELVATSATVTVADTSQGTTLGPAIEINRARRVGLAGVFDLGPARELEAATIEIDVGVALDTAVEENATLLLPAVAVASTAIEVNRAPRMRRVRDYGAWLRLPDISRVMLVELDHSEGSKYVANYPYVSYPDDSYPHRSYDDVVRSALDISSQMGGATTFGDLSLANDGSLDDWLDLYWAGHEARYYLGEKDWPLEDFLLVARATNAGLGGATTQTMDFDMVETRARLKKPVKTSAENPLALGMIENAPALLKDAATDTYRITEPHSRTIIISVRDSGIPTEDWGDVLASTGLVTLTASPVGLVSFSMLDTLSTVADMVQWVADTLDVPVDAESIAALPEHEVGAFWPPGDNPSGEDVLDTFCAAIGAVWYVDELGYLRAVQLDLPSEEADFEIGPDEIVKGGITLAGMEEPWAGLEVYYSRNYAPLESVSTEASASTNVRNMLVTDWYYSVNTFTGASLAQHPNAQRPVMYTALNGSGAAIAMRNHHMSLRTVRRQRWRVDCLLAPALARVGDTVKVTYPALGFESGVNAFVVAVERNLTDAQVSLEVWF